MKDLFSTIYTSISIVSAILFLISFVTKSSTSVGALISAYTTFAISILMILLHIMINNNFEFFNFILNAGSLLLLLAVLSILLYLTVKYQQNISHGNIYKYYNTLIWISCILLLIQIGVVYYGTNNATFEKTNQFTKITSSFIYLLSVLNGICLIPLFNILTYYKTDGFQSHF